MGPLPEPYDIGTPLCPENKGFPMGSKASNNACNPTGSHPSPRLLSWATRASNFGSATWPPLRSWTPSFSQNMLYPGPPGLLAPGPFYKTHMSPRPAYPVASRRSGASTWALWYGYPSVPRKQGILLIVTPCTRKGQQCLQRPSARIRVLGLYVGTFVRPTWVQPPDRLSNLSRKQGSSRGARRHDTLATGPLYRTTLSPTSPRLAHIVASPARGPLPEPHDIGTPLCPDNNGFHGIVTHGVESVHQYLQSPPSRIRVLRLLVGPLVGPACVCATAVFDHPWGLRLPVFRKQGFPEKLDPTP